MQVPNINMWISGLGNKLSVWPRITAVSGDLPDEERPWSGGKVSFPPSVVYIPGRDDRVYVSAHHEDSANNVGDLDPKTWIIVGWF